MTAKKILILIILCHTNFTFSQTRGVKIGFIDMEYILEKVPNYTEAKNQLELKAQKWKEEVELRKNAIAKLKENLKIEKPLLTKELIEEREEEISFQEKELILYQQARFGPKGDLMSQKLVLIQPVQDQVFNIVQDIAEQNKYDFIYDKSSDKSMLFATARFDISDRVVRQLLRAEKKEQLTTKQQKEQAEKDALEDLKDENPELMERQKASEAKAEARKKLAEDRKAAYEARKKEAEEKKQKLIDERIANRNGTKIESTKEKETVDNKSVKDIDSKASAEEKRKKILEERKKTIETRKKEAEEKRQKLIEENVAKKNGTQIEVNKEKEAVNNKTSKVDDNKASQEASAEEKRNKILEERKKTLENRKKEAEERRKKLIEEREAAKNKEE